ncbi:MAG: hypothetical protein ACOY3I_07125 [Verrucomicrobiota bacterium]
MKRMPSDYLKSLILWVVIGCAGYGMLWWTQVCLSEREKELKIFENDNWQLHQKGASSENLKACDLYREKLEAELEKNKPLFEEIWRLPFQSTQDPNLWKQKLSQALEEFNKKFPDQKDFYYGFSDYRLNLPSAHDMTAMEIQLAATRELIALLKRAGVEDIKAVRRAKVGNNEKNDLVAEKIQLSAAGMMYPFELEFSCRPDAIRRLMNEWMTSKFLFCPRWMEINNNADPQQAIHHLKKDEKLPLISGDERVEIKIGGDFCLWEAY